ncbi:hypothetical protein Scep_027450 [Stephania cephalantha]|uniref:Uncharacterized protein n=1 Tax=Stephania cephalantha TaxID=152367 RepID=A0AAP0EB84_9MAGN
MIAPTATLRMARPKGLSLSSDAKVSDEHNHNELAVEAGTYCYTIIGILIHEYAI